MAGRSITPTVPADRTQFWHIEPLGPLGPAFLRCSKRRHEWSIHYGAQPHAQKGASSCTDVCCRGDVHRKQGHVTSQFADGVCALAAQEFHGLRALLSLPCHHHGRRLHPAAVKQSAYIHQTVSYREYQHLSVLRTISRVGPDRSN